MVTADPLDCMTGKIEANGDRIAIVWSGREYTYRQLADEVSLWKEVLQERGIVKGEVVGLQSDFSFPAISLLLALFSSGNIAALLPNSGDLSTPLVDGRITTWAQFSHDGNCRWENGPGGKHRLLSQLQDINASGFLIFSSGSSGKPKAILHNASSFLQKYLSSHKSFRTLAFLLFDHIAGLDTLFYSLFSGGNVIIPSGRDPVSVCQDIERYQVEVLPVSPTFCRLLLLSKAYQDHDLSSLKVISCGSEPMGEHTVRQLSEVIEGVRIIQKYGASEFGSPPTKSREDGSLWLRLDSEGCRIKVIDDILWVKTSSTMLGYLNADPPEMIDGWLCTNDQVEVDGPWVKILGRKSELINVGGEKVFPAEVENEIEKVMGVASVSVYSEPHAFLGATVCARILSDGSIDEKILKKEIRKHCRSRLPLFKVPTKIIFDQERVFSDRFKKIR